MKRFTTPETKKRQDEIQEHILVKLILRKEIGYNVTCLMLMVLKHGRYYAKVPFGCFQI